MAYQMNNRGRTPLHEAAAAGHLCCIRALISSSPQHISTLDCLDYQRGDHLTFPLHVTFKSTKLTIGIAGDTPFLLACRRGSLSCSSLLFQKGHASLSTTDMFNRTALHKVKINFFVRFFGAA